MPWMQRYSFNAGEVSPLLAGRPDFAKYDSACRKMLNFFVHPQGGASNRPGTRYVGTVDSADVTVWSPPNDAVRLVPFVFSRTEAYVLVFSHRRMQVVVGNGFLPVSEGSSTRFHLVTDYTAADLPLLKFQAQVGDTMILTHENHPVKKLVRTGTYTWTLTDAQFGPLVDPPGRVSAVYSAVPGSTNRVFSYQVTAFAQNGGESYASNAATVVVDSPWPEGKYVSLSWDTVPGATHYSVYKNSAGIFGWIGTVSASNGAADTMNSGRTAELIGNTTRSTIDSDAKAFSSGGSASFLQDRAIKLSYSLDYWLDRGTSGNAYEVSFFFRIGSGAGTDRFLAYCPGSWLIGIDASNRLTYRRNDTDVIAVTHAVDTAGAGTFHFCRLTHTGTTTTLQYSENNGSGSYTSYTASLTGVSTPLATSYYAYLGANSDGVTNAFGGYIDEFCIRAIAGTATVPTSPRTPATTTKVLIHFDGPTLTDDAIDPGDSSPVENKTPFGGGNPGCSAIFNQRLLLGRTDDAPQTIEGSRIGDYFNFGKSILVKDDDALTIPIASRQLAEVYHLVPLEDLVVFTSSTFFTVSGAGVDNRVLTPTNIMVRPKSESPCSATIPPIVVGGVIFFAPPSGTTIQGLGFDFSGGGYEERVASLLAEHLPRLHPIKEWAYARSPDSVVWIVCSDGTGLAFTYLKEHDVYALGQIATSTGDKLVSVAAIPSAERDVTYFATTRQVGGVSKHFIEKLETRISTTTIGSYFMDCALQYPTSGGEGSPVTSITGLGHLAGRTVGIVANGTYIGTATVTAGAVPVPTGTTTACVGLLYDQEVEVLPPVPQTGDGSPFGRTAKVGPRLQVVFSESRGGKFAPVAEGVAASYATLYGFADTGTVPYSGTKEVKIGSLPGALSHLRIVQDAPYPLTLVNINSEYSFPNA